MTITLPATVRAAAERIAATYLEAFIATLAATQIADLNLDALGVALWSAVPALLNVVKELLAEALGRPLRPASWIADAVMRVAFTWGYGTVTLLLATWTDKTDISILTSAAWAAAPAALAAAKALLARRVGDPTTASLSRRVFTG